MNMLVKNNCTKILSIIVALALAVQIMSTNIVGYSQTSQNKDSKPIELEALSQDEIKKVGLDEYGENKLNMILDGKSDYKIVIPDEYDKPLYNATLELKEVIKQMASYDIPLVRESEYTGNLNFHTILIDVIGTINRPNIDVKDGYRTVINDNSISICGPTQEGTRNGIYGFIEDELGCIFLTPEDTYVPTYKSIYLDKTDKVEVPKTQWRDVYSYDVLQNKWSAKLRLNGIDVSDETKVGDENQYYEWGTWCHNCYQFLSPDEYFESHPEYFSQFLGKRVHKYRGIDAYLCLSNPEVFEIVKNNLAKEMEKHPEQIYWDFSGNDNPYIKGCQCSKCRKADKEAGGTGMGTLLPFLNKLAKAFPEKYISTLAYTHTLKAPKNIKAEPNVIIKLCSMPGDQSSSYLYGGNKNSKEFKEQIEEWTKVTDKIVVWDYVVDFKNLLMPFPNFGVQVDNQKFYEDNNLIGIFHQASREKGGEFSSLRAYVLSRLMWEGSNMDLEKCISRYISAYYGNASQEVIEYINLTSKKLYDSNKPLGLYDGVMPHIDGYLSKDSLKEYQDILERAKIKAKGDSTLEEKLEDIELSVTYATMLLPNISESYRNQLFDRYCELCQKKNITKITEWDTFEEFNDKVYKSILIKSKLQYGLPYILGAGLIVCGAGAFGITKFIKKRKNR